MHRPLNAGGDSPDPVRSMNQLGRKALHVREYAAGDSDPIDEHLQWEQTEHKGQPVEVSHQSSPVETRVRIEQGGAAVSLSSADLRLEALLDLALRLEPVVAPTDT